MILVTGATGRIGGRAARLLHSRGLPLRLLVRDPLRAPEIAEAEVVVGDYADPPSLDRAFAGCDTVFVVSAKAPPGERAKLHENAFLAAKRAGVGHVVYLSLQGAVPDSSYPYARDHWRSERALQATGLPHTILRNGKYAEQILALVDEDGVVRGPAGEGRVAWITQDDSARMVAAVLADPPGGILEYAGLDALTLHESMAILSSVVGRRMSFAEETAEAVRAREVVHGAPEWKADLKAGEFVAISHQEYAAPIGDFERIVGEPPQAFWRWAVGSALLDPWRPVFDVREDDVRDTTRDLEWIDDLDDPDVQTHLQFLARRYEGTEGSPALLCAFLALFERLPTARSDGEGTQAVLFMLSTLPDVHPRLVESLGRVPSSLGVALAVRLLTDEAVFYGDIDLRAVLQGVAHDPCAPNAARWEARDWLDDPDIEPWLRIPGEPIPEGL